MDMNQYLDVFIDESKEHLQTMNDRLLDVENEPENLDLVQEIFRAAHTLKGMAATMGFEDVATLTHEMENVLDKIRNQEIVVQDGLMDVLFESVEVLEQLVAAIIENEESDVSISATIKQLSAALDPGNTATADPSSAQEATNEYDRPNESRDNAPTILESNQFRNLNRYEQTVIQQSIESGYGVYDIHVRLQEDCVLKAARAYMVVEQLEKKGEIIKSDPSTEDIENEQFDRSFSLMYISEQSADSIDQLLHSVSELEQVQVHTWSSSTHSEHIDEDALQIDPYEQTVIQQSVDSGYSAYRLFVQLRNDCVLKAARAYMVFDLLEKNGDVLKAHPPVEDIEAENFNDSFTIIFVSKKSATEVQNIVQKVSELHKVDVQQLGLQGRSTQNQILRDSSSPSAPRTDGETNTSKLPARSKTVKAGNNAPNQSAKKDKSSTGSRKGMSTKTIRVNIERLDALMNLFSELVIDRGRLEQISNAMHDQQLEETVEHMGRISGDLQDLILNMRMVPIEQVFNRFPRMVRGLAKDLNKQVDLQITGQETELDRTVIDEIGDPLVHLLRNALDHGLETPEKREQAGKDASGTVHLSAYHSGNHVFIEIQDDGQGIDRDKVVEKAVGNGIISADRAQEMPDHEVYQLLFASGFSTADQISDISGRGVGLDVVSKKIESLGGTVTIDSEPGKGTTFRIQLPLTLSIISAMLVVVGTEKYAIPLNAIIETAVFSKKDIQSVHGQHVIRFREKVVPLLSLREFLGVPGKESDESAVSVVIVRKGEKLAGLIVDSFIGQQEIVLKSLGQYLTNVFAISGATILGDGQVALIIDSNVMIK